MKQGKNPTRQQMQVLEANKMNPKDWLIVKALTDRLECVHRHTNQTKTAYRW